MKLTVVGCGKMGLPLAVQAASRGHDVTGVDVRASTIEAINRGDSPISEPGIGEMLRDLVRAGRLKATVDLGKAVSRSDAVIVLVPVVLSKSRQADLKTILSVANGISKAMRPGAIVSFETTLPVGTTRNVILPVLERGGRKAEKDFYLIFSPERVKSNTVMEQMKVVPKVVGGAGPLSLKKGLELYRSIFTSEVVPVKSLEIAEMIKLAGMVYRDVNIALVNDMARYCEKIGIDIDDVIRLANTDGEASLLSPGIGVGGHCTPVYPYFLINDARRKKIPQTLAESARKINDSQAEYMVGRLEKVLKKANNRRVLMLGLGFRRDVKEDLCSPAYLIKRSLIRHGLKPLLYDPLYTKKEITEKGFDYSYLGGPDNVDAVILVTAHSAFSKIDWKGLKKRGVRVVIDGRNYFKREQIEKMDIEYIGIGK